MKLSETTTHGITCKCGEIFQTTDDLENHIAAHRWQPDPQDRTTRKPTDEEIDDLIKWYRNTHNVSRKDAVETIDQCVYLVIEDYKTGSPGYTGRVLIEIGSAGPSFHRVYTWHNNTLQQCEPVQATSRQGDS
jgi:hypothetical protein